MGNRSIRKVYNSQKVNMGGIILDQPLPQRDMDALDPILLIHHWDDTVKGGQHPSKLGVGPHPHRGFSPVTFIFQGGVHHRDSSGISGVIYEGGTQWMNSGRGIVHSERPNAELAANGGNFELIQFWVNSPAKSKMNPYHYQPVTKEETPIVSSKDGKIKVAVVAGEMDGAKGPIFSTSPMLTMRIEAEADGKQTLTVPSTYNGLMYVLDGDITINGQRCKDRQMVIFNNDGDHIEIEAHKKTRAILLAGEPINEPIVSYGPFVMNSQQEIMEAMRAYQAGELGELIENFG
jgi:redox-sensitive bicupin YhaK (pirin superfamily)